MPDAPTDRELLQRARSDPASFGEFYRRHIERIVRFAAARVASSEEVADLVAATFLTALERASTYDPARGEPVAWLYGIAARLLANQRRRQVRERLAYARLDARALLEDSDVERIENQIHATSMADRMRVALTYLPETQQEILLLVGEGGEVSSAAGAKALGISAIAFRVRLARARRALRAAMDETGRGAADVATTEIGPPEVRLTIEELVP